MQVICAGSVDTFQVYVWSVRTGRLLDVLAGHEGPVAGLAFSPTQSLLASASWDKTVRTWDVFRSAAALQAPLQHVSVLWGWWPGLALSPDHAPLDQPADVMCVFGTHLDQRLLSCGARGRGPDCCKVSQQRSARVHHDGSSSLQRILAEASNR